MAHLDFDSWFSLFAGMRHPPHQWQRSLASSQEPRSRLIRVPTGMGKTLGVLAAWAWHRLDRQDDAWPRRLVWCLPMRVLVEQTDDVVRRGLVRLGCLWDGATDHAGKVGVHLLMGGADPGGDWNLFPEENAVLIGTQDMLLSRALNRGYASGRARWPLEFGLLSHDSLWVMDEVQLMDVGLATSAQLQAYHDNDSDKGFRPRQTWWMSATLQPAWLKSVDTEACYEDWTYEPTMIPFSQRAEALGPARKHLDLEAVADKDTKAFARLVWEKHSDLTDGEHGRITLVVCNTVDRACRTFDELRNLAPTQEVRLVHSRFRAAERSAWRQQFLGRETCTAGTNRIIVATQVVEAGVDVSAGCVVTDLAPWPSLVQRFGRCARYGGDGICVVVDRGRDDQLALPYSVEELESAWAALATIGSGNEVGLAALETFEEQLDHERRNALFPYEPRHLLLRREFDELFDTTPDLTGADLDISRFIRTGEERDLQVFWLDVPRAAKRSRPTGPSPQYRPRREELCAVPFLRARTWLCGEETQSKRKPRLRASIRAWVWDWIDADWVIADRPMLTPGRVVCVAADCGGYDPERGFHPTAPSVALFPQVGVSPDIEAQNLADDGDGADHLSTAAWKTIACHVAEVADVVEGIATATGLPAAMRNVLVLAARWHDVGKAHPAFQGSLRRDDRPTGREDIAKAPPEWWPRPPKSYRTLDDRDLRPGLRHELASALALFAVLATYQPRHAALLGLWTDVLELTGNVVPGNPDLVPPSYVQDVLACSAADFDLLAYLVACHHGKVRSALHAGPKDQDYRDSGDSRGLPIRGIRDGDVLPELVLNIGEPPLAALTLTLEPASLGLSPVTGRSWRERTLGLADRFGPGALAWLEALIMAADRRASRFTTPDPALADWKVSR
jgi:CRISPR-associated endonuclease/helicase Cas3